MALSQNHSAVRPYLKSSMNVATCTRSAILFGHSDADGHLAAEQTRYHLMQKKICVTTIVSNKTNSYRFWGRLADFDLTNHELVVFVDIAFSFRDPEDSLARLLTVSDRLPHKQFIVIDHHPLPAPRDPRGNVLLLEVPDPFECCLGIPDPDIMQVAALCDGAPTNVIPTPLLQRRALGVKRAAADVGGIAGDKLLELIRERRWDFIEALAGEDREMHQSARGLRRQSSQTSPLLDYARLNSPLPRTI